MTMSAEEKDKEFQLQLRGFQLFVQVAIEKAAAKAFQAGQKDMRERAAKKAESMGDFQIADVIESLPLTEDGK